MLESTFADMKRIGASYNSIMGAAPVLKMALQEYLDMERTAEYPSDYYDGEIFPKIHDSLPHGQIVVNLSGEIRARLKGGPCRAAGSATRLRVAMRKLVYPDLIIVCGEPKFAEDGESLLNPIVIVEVSSPSTEGYDYSRKFELYQTLPSFVEYVLVAQDSVKVNVFRRSSASEWVLRRYEGLQESVPIDSVGISIPMAEIYDGVAMPSPAAQYQ